MQSSSRPCEDLTPCVGGEFRHPLLALHATTLRRTGTGPTVQEYASAKQ